MTREDVAYGICFVLLVTTVVGGTIALLIAADRQGFFQ